MRKFGFVVFWTLIVLAPLLCIGYFSFNAVKIIQQGEARAKFWIPKKCEIIEDMDAWREKIGGQDRLYLDLPIDLYRQRFENDDIQHYARITSDELLLGNYQGKVWVSARHTLNSPPFVNISEFEYLGNGEILWKLKHSIMGDIGILVCGLFLGFVCDLIIFVVSIVADTLYEDKYYRWW